MKSALLNVVKGFLSNVVWENNHDLAKVKIAMRQVRTAAVSSLMVLLFSCAYAFALDPSLDINQYAHRSWTVLDGFSLGNIYGMAQTPDGYLWLASEFGLFRFDGVKAVPWQPPAGQHLPEEPNCLRVTRDGTLWIGMFAGLASWNGHNLTRYSELDELGITTLFEDHEGTLWVGTWPDSKQTARLCAIRNGRVQCYGVDGIFGPIVESLHEDTRGNLWVVADSGLWQWNTSPPHRYAIAPHLNAALDEGSDGKPLLGVYGAGLLQFDGSKVHPYPIRSPSVLVECSWIRKLMRTGSSETAMEAFGSLRESVVCFIFKTAGQTYLQNPMASPEMSSYAYSKTGKETSGLPQREDWTNSVNSRFRRSP